MKRAKTIVSLALSACLLGTAVWTEAVRQPVAVLYEGEALPLGRAEAYYDDTAKTAYVPLAALAGALGGSAVYMPETGQVRLEAGTVRTVLRPGTDEVDVNGVRLTLPQPVVSNEGLTYVPIALLREAFFMDAQYEEDTESIAVTPRAQLALGNSTAQVNRLLGSTLRTETSEKGYTWQVYDTDYSQYTLAALEKDQVVAYYMGAQDWAVSDGLRAGMPLSRADEVLSGLGYTRTPGHGYAVYTGERDVRTLFYGNGETQTVYALLTEETRAASRSQVSAASLASAGRLMLDLVNVERVREGLDPLVWDNTVADTARGHAQDMAKNNFFSHEGSDGKNPAGRLNAAGLSGFYQIEAISKAFPSSFTAFAAHRGRAEYDAVLHANYKSYGAGVAYNPKSDGILYYTQVFFAPKK